MFRLRRRRPAPAQPRDARGRYAAHACVWCTARPDLASSHR